MASKDTTDAVSVPQPEPGSTVATQLEQIEHPPEPSSYDAFATAAQQETDPTYQAFKSAAATKTSQMQLPGEGILPWQLGSRFAPSFWEHALETTTEMAIGTERALANLFDPKALYSKQTDAQLEDGISNAQHQLDQLQADIKQSPDEYSVNKNFWQIAGLQNDINAMQKQLMDRRGNVRVPDPWERAGEWMRGDIGEAEAAQQQIQKNYPLNPVFEAGPAGRVAQLAGGVAPYIPLGELGPIPEMALGAGQAYESAWQEGEHMGVDPNVTNRAALWSSAFMPAQIGAFRTALAPFMSGMVGRTVRELLTDAAKNAATGAAVGGGQTIWNNVVASTSGLDPNRKITDGLAQSIMEQAGTMTALGLVTQAPSFALRAGSNPRIDAYKAPGAPEAQAGVQAPEAAATAAVGIPGETTEAYRQRIAAEGAAALQPELRRDIDPIRAAYDRVRHGQLGSAVFISDLAKELNMPVPELEEHLLARQRLGMANLDVGHWPTATDEQRAAAITMGKDVMGLPEKRLLVRFPQVEPLARGEVGPLPPPSGVPQPLARWDIQDALSELRDRVGPRADFLLADERSLPLRYNKALADQGLNRHNFKAFFDRDTNDLIVNQKNITSVAELNDIVNRNFIPNTFRGLANIVPLDSWHQVADNPAVASLLARDPHADTTTSGLYDPQSGTVFTNVSKINSGTDAIAEGLSTAVHEISVHQGLRSQFSADYPALDRFLERVWNGFGQTGTGDQVATAAGARNLDELARSYGLGTEQPDGTLTLSDRERGRLAEELLARYSERFDPAQLDKAPGVLQRAIGLVKDGLARFQGLHFTDDQAFRFIRDSWRGTEPPRSPEVNSGLLARRIIKTYEPPELERARANDAATRDIADAIRGIGGPAGRESLAAGATHIGPGELAGASDRVGAYAASTGRGFDYGRLAERSALRVPVQRDAEHEVHVPAGARRDTILKVTRPDGRWGPYGPGLERVPAEEQGLAPGDARTVAGGAYRLGPGTPESYLDRLALSNELFGAGNHLEGFTRVPGSDAWSIASTQPRVMNFRPSTPLEIADYMATKGFHPVDERTYYDPERQIAVLDAHGGNVLTEQATGKVHPVDVVPTRVDEEAAAHMQRMIEDPARLEAMKDHIDLEALQRQLAGKGIDLEAPRSPAAQMRMEDHFQRDEDELADLRAKDARQGLSPEERQRMDDIEFGPLMKRDLELELGPEADPNEPAHRLLQRAYETIMTADPSVYGVRVHALRTVINPRDYMSAREFNSAFDQLLYEKGGKAIWQRITNDIYDQYHGDVPSILNNLTRGVFPDDASAQVYKRLWNDLADLRQQAIQNGDTAKQLAIELARNKMDAWANRDRTMAGKKLASWQDVYYSAQGILGKTRSDYFKEVQKELLNHPEFAEAVSKILGISRDLTKSAEEAGGVKTVLDAAQRLHNFRVPAEYAKAIAEELSNRFGRAQAKPEEKAALDQVFNRFKQTIAQKIKEQGAALPMPDTKKMSASARVIDALSNWHWFEDAWNQTINELKNAPNANPLFFAKVRDALDAPFSGSELQRVMKEQDVNINDLFRQHRSRIGASIDTLSEFLSKRSNLSPEKAAIVQRTVEAHIQSEIRERIGAEFQKIIDTQAKPKGGVTGKDESMKRLTGLIHMGAFDNQDVANALAPVYGFKGFSPELGRRLTALSDQLEQYRKEGRNGFQTEGIRQQMLRTIAEYAKGQIGKYWISIFTGNLMSGIPTHVIAFASELMQGVTNMMPLLPWDRPAEVVPALLESLKTFGKGMADAARDHSQHIWRTGYDPALFRTEQNVTDDSSRMYGPNIFETKPVQRALAKTGAGPAGKVLDVPYRQEYRSISLLHNLIFSGFGRGTEMLAALRIANERGMSFPEGIDWARDMIYANQGKREAYAQIARNEGLSGAQARMRVQELIDQGRQLPGQEPEPAWQTAARERILDQSDFFGTRANFLHDPEGALGYGSYLLSKLGEKIPWFKQYFPFVRVPTNLINDTINWTPWGLVRYLDSEHYLTSFGRIKVDPERVEQLKANILMRSIAGTLGTLGVAIAAGTLKDQDGNPLFQIHGAGPNRGTVAGKQLYYQQLDAGWKPYSIQIGNHYIPFEETPVWGPLQMIGNYYDTQRYSDHPDGYQAVMESATTSLKGLFEHSTLTGLHEVLGLLTDARASQDETVTALQRQMVAMKSFIPLAGANIAKQEYQDFVDNRLYQSKGPWGFARDIPFAASAVGLKPQLNFFGQPVRLYPWSRLIGTRASDDPLWEFLDRNDISLSKPSARAEINGKRIKEDDELYYNYTGFRGAEIHRLLTAQLPSLEKITGRDEEALRDNMKKAIGKIEAQADAYAKRQLILGNRYEVPNPGGAITGEANPPP